MNNCSKRIISVLLVIVMSLGFLPTGALFDLKAEAASNYENNFEGQDGDVFSALGFDVTQVPAGFDEETTDNPYGRDIFTGNQVFEVLLAGNSGYSLYGNGDNNVDIGSLTSASGASAGMPNVELMAGVAGDFDGDGLPGEVAYVGITPPNEFGSGVAQLQLFVFDAKTGTYSASKSLGGITPYNTASTSLSATWPTSVVIGNAANQQTLFTYNWQNLLQITSGDYDGDGTSEIAVYVADKDNPRVDIYKYQRTSQSTKTGWLTMSQWARQWSYAVPKFGGQVANMVSLVSGDFNRDGVDDLAISHGNTSFYVRTLSMIVAGNQASTASILWGGKTNMLQTMSPLDLGAGHADLGPLSRVSLAFGDANGDGTKELVMTGQPTDDGLKNTKRAVATYVYDENAGMVIDLAATINVVDGQMVEADGKTEFATSNGFDDKYYSKPYMKTNAAVLNPVGDEYTYIYVDSVLVRFNNGSLSLACELDDPNYDNSSEKPIANYWADRIGDKDGKPNVGNDYVEYNAISGDISGGGYDILNVSFMKVDFDANEANFSRVKGNRNISLAGNGSGGFKSNLGSREYLTDAIAATLPDCDYDTVLIQYSGIHELSYSNPEVIAVIAAAPYFEDVDAATGYTYADSNSTSFSTMKGSGHSTIFFTDFSIGGYFSAEGSKLAKGELETSLGFTLNYEKEWGYEREYTLTYETSGNEDAVAFYCIPIETFTYYVYTPNGDGTYSMEESRVVRNFSPVHQVLSLDYYESIQGNYRELPQIKGKVLTSTPGDPASYPSSTSGYDVVEEWNRRPAGISFGNGSINQEISFTESESKTYTFGGYWDFMLGGGIHYEFEGAQVEIDITGGVEWSLNIGGGFSDIDMTGTTISGTVANMPEEFRDYGYYFNWKIFSYRYKFGDNEIPVVSYIVDDVSKPPQLPIDFQQDYDRTTSSSNCLTWTYSGDAAKFYLYKYHDFPVGGGLDLLKEIPISEAQYKIKYDSDGRAYKEYYYIDSNLSPYTEYKYSIQVERLAAPPLSAQSWMLSARTKTDVGYPTMELSESDGKNDGQLLVYPDKNAYLTVNVTGPDNQSATAYYSTVQYQWQKRIRGTWTDIANATDKTLTYAAAGVDTAGEYRCLVNVQPKQTAEYISAYTEFVTVSHAKRTSYMEDVRVSDADGGGIELYAKVKNAHGDSSAIPSGTVDFKLTSTKTGITYAASVILDSTGTANIILERTLPAGMYTVEAEYSGSYIFKDCSGDALFLSQTLSGFSIDALDTVTYGDGATITFESVKKDRGATSSEEAKPKTTQLLPGDAYSALKIDGATTLTLKDGVSTSEVAVGKAYTFKDSDGISYYFTATRKGTVTVGEWFVFYPGEHNNQMTHIDGSAGKYRLADNTPAGSYVIRMTSEGTDAVTVEKGLVVLPKNIALRLPTEKTQEGTDVSYPKLGSLEIVSGSWAECDITGGALMQTLAGKDVKITYTNTAGKTFDNTTVDDFCGYYTTGYKPGTSVASNYFITFIDGSMTVLGAANELHIGAREFANLPVGTVYTISPEYASTREDVNSGDVLVQKHQTGTRVVLTAVPDSGYEVYEWYVNDVAQDNSSTTFSHVMLYEETTIEVQFGIKRNTLTFGADGDAGGGTIKCNKSDLTSGSVVVANSEFTFTATAKPGYHFKEWRYTEIGQGTVYDDKDNGAMTSTFNFRMPKSSCAVYAVFERDFYTLTLDDTSGNNGLAAWYYGSTGSDSTAGTEKIYIASGEMVKGDTEVIVGAADGYSIEENSAFVSIGSKGKASYADKSVPGSVSIYTVTVKEDTTVSCVTVHNTYDVELTFDVTANQAQTAKADLSINYVINDEADSFRYDENIPTKTLSELDGGRPISFSVDYPEYYEFVGWRNSASSFIKADTTKNHVATGLSSTGSAVNKGQAYYYSVYSNGVTTYYYFTATESGFVEWTDEDVTITITDPSYAISALAEKVTLTAVLKEKKLSTVTLKPIKEEYGSVYNYESLPEGAFETKDGNNTVINVHEGDDLRIAVVPGQSYTVTFWDVTDTATGKNYKTRAEYLNYTFQSISGDYTFEPIFASTTYNTISWPKISSGINGLTLSAERGYLSSVESGGDFKFKLSGGSLELLDTVYANGHQFLKGTGNKVGDTIYSYEGEGGNRVYTISNIKENQVVSVSFDKVGITVNGIDISAFTGAGWSYNPTGQKLSITNSSLTIGGVNSKAPALSIETGEGVGTLTFKDLSIVTSAQVPVKSMRNAELTLTVSGSNSIESESTSSSVTLIKASNGLTVRGAGELTLSTNAPATVTSFTGVDTANGALTVTGSATLDISAEYKFGATAYGVFAETVNVGADGLTTSPTLRVNLTNGHTYNNDATINESGIYTDSCNTYGGNLLVSAPVMGMSALEVNSYGGIVEIKGYISYLPRMTNSGNPIEDISKYIETLVKSWLAHYPNGYQLSTSDAGTYSSELMTSTVKKSAYDGDDGKFGYVNVIKEGGSTFKYILIQPYESSDGNVTLTVTDSGGISYTGLVDVAVSTTIYYYLDESDKTIKPAEGALGLSNLTTGTKIVAYTQTRMFLLDALYASGYSAPRDTGVSYDYELTGVGSNWNVYTKYEPENLAVKSLTLNSFSLGHLGMSDAPLILKGANYLTANKGTPLSATDGKLNIRSDGNGSLTLTTGWQASATTPVIGNKSVLPLTLNLHNVKHLTMYGGTGSVMQEAYTVNYYDDSVLCDYGRAWKQDVASKPSAAESRTLAAFDGSVSTTSRYVKFYSASADFESSESALSYDKAPNSTNNTASTLRFPISSGKIKPFNPEADTEPGTITLVGADSKKLTSGTDFTWSGSSTSGLLTLKDDLLKTLEVGSYTLRMDFADQSYRLNIPLTVVDTSKSTGGITVSPDAKTVLRGDSVDFTTAFTGTTPKSYKWELSGSTAGDGTALTPNGSGANLVIGSTAAFGDLSVTVTAYANDDGQTNTLGSATAKITVSNSASAISIFCSSESPSGDGSFTLNNSTTGDPRSWDFDATIVLDSGEEPDYEKLAWSLDGNRLRTTIVDEKTGVLTINPYETGTDGKLELTAEYQNGDGSISKATVIIHLSDDAFVSYTKDAKNGKISTVTVGTESSSITESGEWIAAGSTVTATAAPDENYSVSRWYVNGLSVMENSSYTIDAENNTLSFTAAAAKTYAIKVDFANNNSYTVTYAAGEKGSLSASYDGKAFVSGESVTAGESLTLKAVPDEHCEIAGWTVNEKPYQETEGTDYIGAELILTDISEDCTVSVSFRGRQLDLQYIADGSGTLTAFINDEKANATENPAGTYSASANALDRVIVYAKPADNYQVQGWYIYTGSEYELIPGSAGQTSYEVQSLTEALNIKAVFEKAPVHTLTVSSNSREGGRGSIVYESSVVPAGGSDSFTVKNHSQVSLLAVANEGSEFRSWAVTGATYQTNGPELTILDITGDVTVAATFASRGFDVTLNSAEGGTLTAGFEYKPDNSTGSIGANSSVRVKGGSTLTFTITPDSGYILKDFEISNIKVMPSYDKVSGTYTYVINTLASNVAASASFIAPDIHEVTGPDGSITGGTTAIGFVEDGISGDTDDTDSVVEIAEGGTATITFEATSGHAVDIPALFAQINNVLDTASSKAECRIIIDGTAYVAEISGVDMALNFSGVNPFVSEEPATEYRAVTYASVENGSLVAEYNGAVLEEGAKVPAGAELIVTATPDEHYIVSGISASSGSVSDQDTAVVNSAVSAKYKVGDEDVRFGADFEIGEYLVTINITGTGSGAVNEFSASKQIYFPAGSSLVLTATPENASKLTTLIVDGELVDGGTKTVTVDRNIVITARFDVLKCKITIEQPTFGSLVVRDGEGNTVSSGDEVAVGETLIILPTPDDHYKLDKVTAGGAALSKLSYVVDASKNNIISCSFVLAEAKVTWTSSAGGALNVTYPDGTSVVNGDFVAIDTEIRVEAVAKKDYTLDTLKLNGSSITNNNRYKLNGAMNFEAAFKYTGSGGSTTIINEGDTIINDGKSPTSGGSFNIAIVIVGTGTVSVTADGEAVHDGDLVERETVLSIGAAGTSGAMLKSLTVNGVEFKSGRTYEVFANTEIKAVFDAALPYYLDENENRVFIGLSYDANESGSWEESEYLAPAGKKVYFSTNEKEFTDISGHWGKDVIDFVTQREIFVGTSANKFSPDGVISRAMFATAIGRLYERSFGEIIPSGERAFSDCDYDAYYGKYIDWAAENGIVKGYGNGQFGPSNAITREQMASIIYNFAQFMDALPEKSDSSLSYTDSAAIADWAREAALFCQMTDIIKGVGGGVFAPRDTATRAQAAGIMKNFIIYYFS